MLCIIDEFCANQQATPAKREISCRRMNKRISHRGEIKIILLFLIRFGFIYSGVEYTLMIMGNCFGNETA